MEEFERVKENIDLLIHTMRLHHRIVEKRMEGMGVHHGQHRMLMKVSYLGKSASQKALAEAMDVSPACVARTLKQLSAAGLIDKAEGADGRCNEISLMPRGRELVENSRAIFREIGEEMFEGVSDADMEALGRILRTIQGNLVNMERGEGETCCDEERS